MANGDEKCALWAVDLFLIGVLPTSGMTISWTGFAKSYKEAAIKMVVFGLIIGALAAPVYTKLFMGATIDVKMFHMFKQIALFVFVPLAAGLFTHYAAKKKYGKASFLKINIDENTDIAMKLGIQSIPTIIIFQNGRELKRMFGMQSAYTLRNTLNSLQDSVK